MEEGRLVSILSKNCIVEQIKQGKLILDAEKDPNGDFVVQAASYDLRAGRVIWKEPDSQILKMERYDSSKSEQSIVSLRPGQMVIVVAQEELNLPGDICGTVYSRNRLQKANILALNAGHVDPAFNGQIIIRLINLGSTVWTLALGEPIFTIVFEQLMDSYNALNVPSSKRDARDAKDTLEAARRTAEQAFSNPFHDLYQSEIKKQLIEHDSQLEIRLREKLAMDFFRKNQVQYLVIEVAVALIGALVLVLKVPWGDIVKWLL